MAEGGLRRIPDQVYTDEAVYQREVEHIFHGRTRRVLPQLPGLPRPEALSEFEATFDGRRLTLHGRPCAHRKANESCNDTTRHGPLVTAAVDVTAISYRKPS